MHLKLRTYCTVLILLVIVTSSQAFSRDTVKIAGKTVSVKDITLNADFHFRASPRAGEISYTFYLDQRDLKIADRYKEQYFNRKPGLKKAVAIMLMYIEDDFKNYPCLGKNKCVKEVTLSVKGFFNYLNSHPELRTQFLDAWAARPLFAPKYKSMDRFMFDIATGVGYAFYGISYMQIDFLYVRTIMDKMIFAIRNGGYNSGM